MRVSTSVFILGGWIKQNPTLSPAWTGSNGVRIYKVRSAAPVLAPSLLLPFHCFHSTTAAQWQGSGKRAACGLLPPASRVSACLWISLSQTASERESGTQDPRHRIPGRNVSRNFVNCLMLTTYGARGLSTMQRQPFCSSVSELFLLFVSSSCQVNPPERH